LTILFIYFFPSPALNIFEKVCKTKNKKMLALYIFIFLTYLPIKFNYIVHMNLDHERSVHDL